MRCLSLYEIDLKIREILNILKIPGGTYFEIGLIKNNFQRTTKKCKKIGGARPSNLAAAMEGCVTNVN